MILAPKTTYYTGSFLVCGHFELQLITLRGRHVLMPEYASLLNIWLRLPFIIGNNTCEFSIRHHWKVKIQRVMTFWEEWSFGGKYASIRVLVPSPQLSKNVVWILHNWISLWEFSENVFNLPLITDLNKKFWEESIVYFPLIRHGHHRRRRLQQFFVPAWRSCYPIKIREPTRRLTEFRLISHRPHRQWRVQ
jgi:hypothetical protein